jgi:hypothetical protein
MIALYGQRVASLTNQKGELSKLNLDLDVREAEYRLLSQEEAQASLAAIQQLGEIRQLYQAAPPVYPASPIKIYYAAAGLVLGLMLSLLIVLVMDYTDPRVRDMDDVSGLRVPVIAVVPHTAAVSPHSSLTILTRRLARFFNDPQVTVIVPGVLGTPALEGPVNLRSRGPGGGARS